MTQLFTNNASAKLAAAVAPGDVTFSVQTGQGAEFPSLSGSDFFIGTLESADGLTREIVKVTARATDAMTVTRAQEGTSAGTFNAGDKFDCRLTAGALATIMGIVYDPEITALAAVVSAADKIPYFTALGVAALLTRDTDPTLAANSATHLATQDAIKAYVDSKLAGLSWKQEVRAATTVAGTLASSFANGSTIDGVTLATGDRILLKNQSAGAENGIYIVAASGAPTRATDADAGAELVNAACFVSEGTANAETVWVCSNNATITVGSTSLTFVQFGAGVSTLAALSDTNISSPANGDLLTYDTASSKWKNHAPASGASRSSVTKTTGSLANNAAETGTITMAKWGEMGEISVDRDCRIRLYATSSDRTADSARALGTPCPTTTSMLAEWSFQSGVVGSSAQSLRRLSVGFYNADGSPTTSIYYEIVNLSQATSTVAVTIHYLPMET
jgi:hypothetical protein